MSLLPALFQNTDPMPMALGAKIIAPVSKKPDPFKAFEKGDHHQGGLTVTLDLGRPDGDWADYVITSADGGRMTFVESARKSYRDAYPHVVRKWFEGESERRTAVGMPPAAPKALDELRLQYRDQMPTLREEAIAAKMAEVQRQKQELRALVRKDGKR